MNANVPGVQSDLDAWLKAVPETFDLLLDPEGAPDSGITAQTISPTETDAGFDIPTVYAIDPRTMKITALTIGYDPTATSDPAIDALLMQNP